MRRGLRWALGCGASAIAGLAAQACAQEAGFALPGLPVLDPTIAVTGGAVLFALATGLWGVRMSAASRTATVDWSRRLATMEARLERSESVLASHPGLVLVWDDAFEDIKEGWGNPRVLGGPAALASLLTFARDDPEAFFRPADALLDAFGDLPVDEDADSMKPLREKVLALRSHGVSFSGSVVTDEGRSIDCDGRVAGDQVTLWLTDPAVRLAEEAGVVGHARDRAADLHGALNQLDRAPLAAWRRGSDLKLEWVNRAYVEMVEAVNMDQVIDEQIEIDPAFRALAERAEKEMSRSGRRAVDDVATVIVRGQRRVLRIIETAMHGAGDAALGGVAIDVTRQDRAQEDLRRHQDAHRKTLDQIPSAVAVFGGQQQLEYYNQAFLDLWRFDDAELRARPSHGEVLDRLRHKGLLPAQADFGAWKKSQLRLYTEEASDTSSAAEGALPDEIWNLPGGVTLNVKAQRHGLGGVTVVFEDVTEKLTLRSSLQAQIDVYRATLNNLAEGVAVFGADGRLALYNKSFRAMWSFENAQMANRHFDEITEHLLQHAPGAEGTFSKIKTRIVSFAPEDRVLMVGQEIPLKDGKTYLYATTPLPDGATLLTFLNVTDSRERQKELEVRNRLLEDTDRIKTKFVDNVSRQLRDPLNTIIGFSEVLEMGMAGDLSDQQKDYAASILMASHRLLDRINELLDLAAIDAGQMHLDMREVGVRGLLEKAATFATLKAEDADVRLRVECAPDVGSIMADEKRLRQVVFNLLNNAFSFTEPGGEVVLEALRENDTVSISVRDTGRGVSLEDQGKIFDRFEVAGRNAGAGLGLTLVNSFVKLHGGLVRLSSAEGSGTTVSCYLPVAGPGQDAGLVLPDEDEDDAVSLDVIEEAARAAG
ncbi:PAS domain-containing sensor histidine kinase [Parvularcula dongshanensis]|uniref:histidine kinase n=1 Tax=Parvularcula dongshanensis TaxID=1173995 RepID=A0A840HYS6_9PROT|nr:PAS domain-containing sensor histidine kinase [Parvularcula dongshanensis]MBB4657729.1 signal transduction histidine kinase [Parvularcula dongshanensis]